MSFQFKTGENSQAPSPPAQPAAEPAPVKVKKRLLVVEDEEYIAQLIVTWQSGVFDVELAGNGKEGLEKARAHPPDIILMDMMMPDMGGFEAARGLQAARATSGVPVIIMTARQFDKQSFNLIVAEPNVKGFLKKPFRPEDLGVALERVSSGQKSIELPDGCAPPVVEEVPPQGKFFIGTPEKSDELSAAGGELMGEGTSGDVGAPYEEKAGSSAASAAGSAAANASSSEPFSASPPPAGRSGREGQAVLHEKEARGGLGPWMVKALVAAVLVFVSAESFSLLSSKAAGDGLSLPRLQPSKIRSLAFELSPRQVWRQGRVVYATNEWGLRDEGVAVETVRDVFRVYLGGGSAVFGEGVRSGATVARQLEVLLNQEKPLPNVARYAVVNGGGWAQDPAGQWALIRGLYIKYNPQRLIWLCESKSEGEPRSARLAALSRAPWAWLQGAPPAFVRVALRWWVAGGKPEEHEDVKGLFKEAWRTAIEEGFQLQIAVVSKSRGRPDAAELDGGSVVFLKESDVEPFRAGGVLSPAGHRFIAQKLIDQWKSELSADGAGGLAFAERRN